MYVDGSQKRNRPFYSCVLSYLVMNSSRILEMTLLWYRPLCFSHLNANWLALEQLDLHNKSSEVYIKTKSSSALLPFKVQATEQTTVKEARNSFHFPQTSFTNSFPNTVWSIVSVKFTTETGYKKSNQNQVGRFLPFAFALTCYKIYLTMHHYDVL